MLFLASSVYAIHCCGCVYVGLRRMCKMCVCMWERERRERDSWGDKKVVKNSLSVVCLKVSVCVCVRERETNWQIHKFFIPRGCWISTGAFLHWALAQRGTRLLNTYACKMTFNTPLKNTFKKATTNNNNRKGIRCREKKKKKKPRKEREKYKIYEGREGGSKE